MSSRSPSPTLTPSRNLFAALLTLSLVAACGGGGGGGGNSAPTGISLPVSNAVFLTGVPVQTTAPSVSGGSADSFLLDPAIAGGLAFSTATGVISGTPTATSAATEYTLTASNTLGSTSTTFSIAVAAPPQFTYVAGSGDDAISIYSVGADTGSLAPLSYQGAALGEDGPEQVVVDSARGFVWVPNLGDGVTPSNISTYTLDPATGLLSAAAAAATGIGPHRMALAPDGSVAYVVSSGSNQVETFSINAGSGALTQVDTDATGAGPIDVAVDPLGRFVWTANRTTATISIFDVSGVDGTLTPSAAPALSLAGMLSSLAVDTTGTQLFATFENFDTLVRISIDAGTGALSIPGGGTRMTGDMPVGLAVHPNGDFLFVANNGSDEVSIFAIAESGAVSVVGGTFPTGSQPASISLDASGSYAYVANSGSNDVSVYSVNQGTGVLTLSETLRTRSAPSSVAQVTGAAPIAAAPQFLYALGADDDTINAFSVDPASGALTPAGAAIMTGMDPSSLAIDPMGRFLVAINETDQTVQSFTIGVGGGPAPAGMAQGGMGVMQSVAIDPSGRFAFVTSSGNVLVYLIDQGDGTLTFSGTRPIAPDVDTVAVDPTGRFVYAATATGGGGGQITSFAFDQDQLANMGALITSDENTTLGVGTAASIRFNREGTLAYLPLPNANLVVTATVDQDTGELSPITPTNAEGPGPLAISLTPDSRFAYAAVSDPGGTGRLAVFSVGATGTLSDLPAVTIGMNPSDVRVGPGGGYVFATNSVGGDVVVASIDPTTGAPTVVASAMAGMNPIAVLVTRQFQ